jgi:hypothetical protein
VSILENPRRRCVENPELSDEDYAAPRCGPGDGPGDGTSTAAETVLCGSSTVRCGSSTVLCGPSTAPSTVRRRSLRWPHAATRRSSILPVVRWGVETARRRSDADGPVRPLCGQSEREPLRSYLPVRSSTDPLSVPWNSHGPMGAEAALFGPSMRPFDGPETAPETAPETVRCRARRLLVLEVLMLRSLQSHPTCPARSGCPAARGTSRRKS